MCNSGAPTTAPTSDPTGVPTSEPTLDTDGRAALYWTCDDESEVYLSRDKRATWELLETTSSWATTGEVWIEDIDPTVDVIRVHCTNSGGGYLQFLRFLLSFSNSGDIYIVIMNQNGTNQTLRLSIQYPKQIQITNSKWIK